MNLLNHINRFRRAALLLAVCASLPWLASSALGQQLYAQRGPPRRASQPPGLGQPFNIGQLQRDIVGVGIWYAEGQFKFDGASSSSSNEVVGYNNVLPTSLTGKGFGIGLSFASWGVNFGFSEGEVAINRTADVNQTPGTTADDPFVRRTRRVNRSIAILYQPVRWFYLGVGRDIGTMEFDQDPPSGGTETKKFSYENDYYVLGLAIGFDPTVSATAPFITAFTKVPTSRGDFTGTVTAAGVGIFF